MTGLRKYLYIVTLAWLPAFLGGGVASAQHKHFPEEQTKQEQLDEAKIHIMGAFATASIESNYPDGQELAYELLAFSQSKNNDEGIASAYSKLAQVYINKRQADTALYFCGMAKALYTKMDDTHGLVSVTCQEAFLDMEANRPEAALQKYQQAMDMAQDYFDPSIQAPVLHGMGRLFLKLRNYTYAENYLLQSLELLGIFDFHERVRIEVDLGDLYRETNQYTKAEEHYEYALQVMKQYGEYRIEMAACKTNLAKLYSLQGKQDQALAMYREATEYYVGTSDTINRASVLGYVAEALARKGLHKQAEDSLQYGLSLIKHVSTLNALQIKARLSEQLYGLYRNMGNFEKALKAYEQQNGYEKEIYSIQTANRIAELKEKYQAEKKEQENQELKSDAEIQRLRFKNQSYVFQLFILGVLLLGVVLVFIWRNFKNRNRQQNMMLEQRLLRSQMNPHFIFNALIAIQSFMYKNEPKEAGSFLSSFARLVRSILENSREELIPLSKEAQWLQNYVKLQQLRFENDMDCRIEFDPSLDVENTWIPPMLVQPFIENAIEHGLSKSDRPGELTVKYTRYKKWLAIHIRDNGNGFDSSAHPKQRREHASMALKITRERLKLINRRKKKKVDLQVFSIKGSGTLISFSIPLIIRS